MIRLILKSEGSSTWNILSNSYKGDLRPFNIGVLFTHSASWSRYIKDPAPSTITQAAVSNPELKYPHAGAGIRVQF